MKKFLIMAVAFLATVGIANAEIKDDIQKSRERAEKISVLCNGYKASGNAKIDGYGNSLRTAALAAVANSEKLENMYKRQIGETVDGVTDVTITKPTLEDWTELAAGIAVEGTETTAAVNNAKEAGEEAKAISENAAKEKNPMKAGKAAKMAKAAAAVVTFGNEATPILLEETAAQAKAVNEIIDILKSGKNL